MNKTTFIKQKMQDLLKVAYGCTEIGVIGYPCSLAYDQVKGEEIKQLTLEISPFIYKNASRVGVPNMGRCGIPMMAATGAYICAPERKLELFSSVNLKQKSAAKKLIERKRVKVIVNDQVNPVYAEVRLETTKGNNVVVRIEKEHDNVVFIKKNDFCVREQKQKEETITVHKEEYSANDFSIKEIIKIVESLQEKDLSFLTQVFKINQEISSYGLKHKTPGSYTDIFAKTFKKPNWRQQIILDTAAAIDARMRGDSLPVMSSCGSGDHGLTISIPQYSFHKLMKTSNIRFLRGLAIANLLTWIIKQNIGSLSALCGSVIAAATSAMVGIAYQSGWTYSKISALIEAMLCANAICICDGAKSSCTFKVSSALSSGFMIFDMVENNYKITARDGIVGDDPKTIIEVFKTISSENSLKLNNSIVKMLNSIN